MRSTALTQDPLIWKCGKGVSIMWFSYFSYFFFFSSFFISIPFACVSGWLSKGQKSRTLGSRIEFEKASHQMDLSWILLLLLLLWRWHLSSLWTNRFVFVFLLSLSLLFVLKNWSYCGPAILQLWRFKVHTVMIGICHMYNEYTKGKLKLKIKEF